MRSRLVLGILGLSLAAVLGCMPVAAGTTAVGADGPTRTDPQGTIGGGVGEFGGPPGPGPDAKAPSAQNRGADRRQDKNSGQKEQGSRRMGSCRP